MTSGQIERQQPRGFTLVELLVVVSIIALLLAILLPALDRARRSANVLTCASNMRQIASGLMNYAADNNGWFPRNTSAPPARYWHNPDVMGRYITRRTISSSSGIGGNALICPDDATPGVWRSYAMNVWASSKSDMPPSDRTIGKLWSTHTRDGSSLMLVVESWCRLQVTVSGQRYYYPLPVAGLDSDYPGERFGAASGLPFPVPVKGFPNVKSELPYYRHRAGGEGGTVITSNGRVNIAYADGHVALKSNIDLGDPQTGRSTFDSLWSPIDREIERDLP